MHAERESIFRLLIRSGPDIDQLYDPFNSAGLGQVQINAVGLAIFLNHHTIVPALHQLRIKMSPVYCGSHDQPKNAVDYAIFSLKPPALALLLDEIYLSRPIELGYHCLFGWCQAAMSYHDISDMLGTLKVLKDRKFDFKALDQSTVPPNRTVIGAPIISSQSKIRNYNSVGRHTFDQQRSLKG